MQRGVGRNIIQSRGLRGPGPASLVAPLSYSNLGARSLQRAGPVRRGLGGQMRRPGAVRAAARVCGWAGWGRTRVRLRRWPTPPAEPPCPTHGRGGRQLGARERAPRGDPAGRSLPRRCYCGLVTLPDPRNDMNSNDTITAGGAMCNVHTIITSSYGTAILRQVYLASQSQKCT